MSNFEKAVMRLVKKNTVMFQRLYFGVSVLGGFLCCLFVCFFFNQKKFFMESSDSEKEKTLTDSFCI